MPGRPSGFDLLDREVQRWVWEQRWPALRPVQEQAIAPILRGDTDVIVTAATAGGKTEAAFLPVCSALVRRTRGAAGAPGGVQALYISPLKALINDQHRRIDALCRRLGVPVTPWHGDVSATRKDRLRAAPSGILMITPESLEATLVLRGSTAPELFADLSHIVIDELHAFLGTARGAQLRSLLHRIEAAAGHRAARIGLSATLADLSQAAEYLRPGGGEQVVVVRDEGAAKEVEVALRGYVEDPDRRSGGICPDVVDDLYRVLRGGHNMVFANSRAEVESCTGMLTERAERDRIPTPFLPHHGSLSAELRLRAEERLRLRSSPTTVVCTSTLELGIDVGWVDSVVQLGVPPSVAGLRQRLGRSGRGEHKGRLLAYVVESARPRDLLESLRTGLIQAVATMELLRERWYEPPRLDVPDFSTLIQQILALTAQLHGARADRLHALLCGSGVFPRVTEDDFALLLREMGARGLLMQDASGLLLPGRAGERILGLHSFYATFDTAEEFQVIASGTVVGTIPVAASLMPGTLLTFGGRHWRVTGVERNEARVMVAPAAGTGAPPGFGGSAAPVGDGVRRRMRRVYESDDVPAYLDPAAAFLLEGARAAFRGAGAGDTPVHLVGGDTVLLPWRGDAVLGTLRQLLTRAGLRAEGADGVVPVRGADPGRLAEVVRGLLEGPRPDPLELAAETADKHVGRYDRYLPARLLDRAHADRAIDLDGAWEVLEEIRG
ncbi:MULTISPECIES: DEAD/DEAH box helicase [unclassified Nocardiopsis]|uniref:DEAD/DEAH box helicase n=1 Tax=Nocardiopsis TaxID=2013 RepID=UPI00387AEDDB